MAQTPRRTEAALAARRLGAEGMPQVSLGRVSLPAPIAKRLEAEPNRAAVVRAALTRYYQDAAPLKPSTDGGEFDTLVGAGG